MSSAHRAFADALKLVFPTRSRRFGTRTLALLRGRARPRAAQELSGAQRQLVAENSRHWSRLPAARSPSVLVEGFLAGYGPNYLVRTAIVARAVADEAGLRPCVVFFEELEHERRSRTIYDSFGIEDGVTLFDYEPGVADSIRLLALARCMVRGKRRPEELLGLEHRGIAFGDLLFDTRFKEHAGARLNTLAPGEALYYVFRALRLIAQCQALLRETRPACYVCTHSQYLLYGVMVRACLAAGVPVLESTDAMLFSYSPEELAVSRRAPLFHDHVRARIREALARDAGALRSDDVDAVLARRFSGEFDQSDVVLAYRGKRVYTREELCCAHGLDPARPCVFVFAHVFADAPQGLTSRMLYSDFRAWLEATLACAAAIPGFNWIVKPHPAGHLYGETDVVARMVERLGAGQVRLCPPDMSPFTIKELAASIVTAQGTIGLEASCLGVPAILGGGPFYAGFGFTHEPRTVAEYEVLLAGAGALPRLSPEQVAAAKQVYHHFLRLSETDTSLIDSTVLFQVWGGGPGASSDEAYRLIAERLRSVDPTRHSLYRRAREAARLGRLRPRTPGSDTPLA